MSIPEDFMCCVFKKCGTLNVLDSRYDDYLWEKFSDKKLSADKVAEMMLPEAELWNLASESVPCEAYEDEG